jgi:hypothetical protein
MRKEAPLLFIKMGGLVSLRVKNNIMQNERPDPKGFFKMKDLTPKVFTVIKTFPLTNTQIKNTNSIN